jgi:hypothetical protein
MKVITTKLLLFGSFRPDPEKRCEYAGQHSNPNPSKIHFLSPQIKSGEK